MNASPSTQHEDGLNFIAALETAERTVARGALGAVMLVGAGLVVTGHMLDFAGRKIVHSSVVDSVFDAVSGFGRI